MTQRTTYTRPKTRKGKKYRSSRLWRYLLIGVAALLVAALAAGIYYVGRRVFDRPKFLVSEEAYPIHGIDVSNHNGPINFNRVAADSIAFVYVKASEGISYKDPRFLSNIDSARKAGLKVGAYHFFRKDRDGMQQARNFIRTVKGVPVDMPYVIDVEDWGNTRFTRQSVTIDNLRAMVDQLEHAEMRIMIYTNKDGYKKYLKKYFPEVQLWLCTFNHPDSVKQYDWKLLQYSHWGTVDGVQGDVDWDVFNGDCEKWERWLSGE